jgi:tetraacyldisaccharide 4'-kinase
MSVASALYAFAARWHRRHHGSPARQRHLRCPVVSIGNLSVGGRGKTPVAAHVARLLRDTGQTPAVLSRGYRRDDPADGVVVVRDPTNVRASLAQAGDEPLMLAFQLPGCAVVVATDRHLAGVLAESRLGCTVHVLDDGFQHHALWRDVDLLLVTRHDLESDRVLPAGRLREDTSVAARADAWLAPVAEREVLAATAARVGVGQVFATSRTLDDPVPLDASPNGDWHDRGPSVLLVSGLARPAQFEEEVGAAGWHVAGHLAFGDHHRFTAGDLETLRARARDCGAARVLTTAKNAVRLSPLGPLPLPAAWMPLVVRVEPAAEFRAWLLERIARTRSSRAAS